MSDFGCWVRFATAVDHTVPPAIGDINGDGIPEIVSADTTGYLLAFENGGACNPPIE